MVTLTDLVETSSRVAAASGRLEKVALLAALLRRLEAAEVEIGTAYLAGSIRQPRLGVRLCHDSDAFGSSLAPTRRLSR